MTGLFRIGAVVSCLTLASCGGGDEDTGKAASPAASPTPSGPTTDRADIEAMKDAIAVQKGVAQDVGREAKRCEIETGEPGRGHEAWDRCMAESGDPMFAAANRRLARAFRRLLPDLGPSCREALRKHLAGGTEDIDWDVLLDPVIAACEAEVH